MFQCLHELLGFLRWLKSIVKVLKIFVKLVVDVGIHQDALQVEGQMLVMQLVFIFNIEFILINVL